MNQQDFLKTEPILTPEKELELAILREKYASAQLENAALKDENQELREQLAWLKKQVFGRKSEKTSVIMEDSEQISMFNEAEVESDMHPAQMTDVAAHKRKAKRTHDEIGKELPVKEEIHKLETENCPKCGSELVVIGKEKVRDELVYIPEQYFIRRHYVEVAKCSVCGMNPEKDSELADTEKQTVIRAKAPEALIPYSFASAELVAHIIHQKYANAVPLNRQERDLKSKGIFLSRSTMANWVIYAANRWFEPIYTRMKEELLKSSVIHADETVVQVLQEPGKKATTDSRMWCYANGKIGDRSMVLFEYKPTRKGANAEEFLKGFCGYLVCDGFDGYNKVKDAKRCACLAHIRRKFVDVLPKDTELLKDSVAAKAVSYCNDLFHMEREYNGQDKDGRQIREPLSPKERYTARQERTRPVLDAFYAWLESLPQTGKENLKNAIRYAINEKKYMYTFLEDGNVPISNNRVENALRPLTVGRRNWLFSASVKGADASAILYSIIATAYANGLNVEQYLTDTISGKNISCPW